MQHLYEKSSEKRGNSGEKIIKEINSDEFPITKITWVSRLKDSLKILRDKNTAKPKHNNENFRMLGIKDLKISERKRKNRLHIKNE